MGKRIDKQEIDLLIVGAGPVGCTIAERAAQVKGWKSLIIDKREHIAGNCHDCINSHGQLVHKYGPHYFRTSYEDVFRYLSKFTSWIPGNYIVKTSVKNNLSTLEKYFNQELDEDTALKLLHSLRVHKENPKNSEEFILSRLGKELYEDFYLGYTLKQWDIHPKDLDPSVCGRVPIRLNRDESYVNATHQVMPKDGFTKMFSRMIESKNIFFKGNTNFEDLKKTIIPKIATVYTGPVDEYFNYCLGRLPWRSLQFEWKTYKEKLVQPCVQINYPNDHKYTRSVEIKHVTKQNINTSTVSYEYPQSVGDPYYPVPQPASSELYLKYKQLAEETSHKDKVYFVGRLAEYTYINTDEAIKKGLDAFQKIANSNGID